MYSVCVKLDDENSHALIQVAYTQIQWNLSLTTTSMIKFIACDLLSNVF